MTPFERARRAAGLSTRDIAAKLNLSHVAVGNWDRGTSSPRVRHIPKIAKLLKKKPEDIVRMFAGEPVAA